MDFAGASGSGQTAALPRSWPSIKKIQNRPPHPNTEGPAKSPQDRRNFAVRGPLSLLCKSPEVGME
jgi:hypothetical protein